MALKKLVRWNETGCIGRQSVPCSLHIYNTAAPNAHEIQLEEEEEKFEAVQDVLTGDLDRPEHDRRSCFHSFAARAICLSMSCLGITCGCVHVHITSHAVSASQAYFFRSLPPLAVFGGSRTELFARYAVALYKAYSLVSHKRVRSLMSRQMHRTTYLNVRSPCLNIRPDQPSIIGHHPVHFAFDICAPSPHCSRAGMKLHLR